MEQGGRECFGPQHSVDPREIQLGERGVLRETGGVDDGGEGVFGGDGVEKALERGSVGDIAGGDGDGCAQVVQVLGELGGTGRVGS